MRKIILAGAAACLLSGCATLDGVGARGFARDATLFAVSQYVYARTGVQLRATAPEQSDTIYRAANDYAAFRRGDITEQELAERIDALLIDYLAAAPGEGAP